MIQYDLRTPWIQNVLVSAVVGECAIICAVVFGVNYLNAAVLGFAAFALILFMLKFIEDRSYTTVTYLDEDDVERIRGQLNATEKEGEA